MKKYNVEIRVNGEDWDAEAVQEYIEAGSEFEAIELAREYLKECAIQNGQEEAVAEIENSWEFRAIEA